MAVYTIRPGFTIAIDSTVYQGGDSVNLSDEQFLLHKHKLEGVGSNIPDLDFGGGSGECCFPAPVVASINPARLFADMTAILTLEGSFFTPDTTVVIDGLTLDSVEFVSDNKISARVTVGSSVGQKNLTASNGKETVSQDAIEILDPADSIIDLRAGGTQFSNNAIEVRSGMNVIRESRGLSFDTASSWGSWARFVGDNDEWTWNRSQARSVAWIVNNLGRGMLGIGSRANNPNNSQQYYQAEILVYLSSATQIAGLYGNYGTPGQGVSQGESFSTSNPKKIVFKDNGEQGSQILVYQLPSSDINDWLDESNLIKTITVGSNFTADEAEIMPFVVPQSGTNFNLLGMILI